MGCLPLGARARWRSLGCVVVVLYLSLACHPAGTLSSARFVAPARFEALAPEADVWRLTTNLRTRQGCRVEWTWFPSALGLEPSAAPGSGQKRQKPLPEGRIFVEVRPLPKRFEPLPLEVVAELRFMKRLGAQGGAPRLDSLQRIALDEREAIALVGSRLDRPLRWRHTLVVLRSQGFLMELGYYTLEEDFDQAAPAFERLLRQLKLLLPGPFDPYVLEDIPLFYPGPSLWPSKQRVPKGKGPAGRLAEPDW